MANGTWESVEKVRAGDYVLSREEGTGRLVKGRVVEPYVRYSDGTIRLTFSSGLSVETTSEHPFFIEGRGWVEAGKLSQGVRVASRGTKSDTLEKIEKRPGKRLVYNFEVEGTHSYFVGDARNSRAGANAGDALWVHNYTIFFEMQLRPGLASFGSRPAHFASANAALAEALASDANLLSKLQSLSPTILDDLAVGPRGGIPQRSPAGFTWHHALMEQAGGRPGVMQLVWRSHHGGEGSFSGWYHPKNLCRYPDFPCPERAGLPINISPGWSFIAIKTAGPGAKRSVSTQVLIELVALNNGEGDNKN